MTPRTLGWIIVLGFALLWVPLLILIAGAHEAPPITLAVNPRVGYQPLAVDTILRIEPFYLNTGWCIAWFQQGAEWPDGRHCGSLEGAYARRRQDYRITFRRAGVYDIVGTLIQVRTTHQTVPLSVHVLESPF